MTDVKDTIRQFIVQEILFGREVANLRDDDSLTGKGILDSTGVLELVGFVEETFEIAIEDRELVPEHLDSVNKIASLIESKMHG